MTRSRLLRIMLAATLGSVSGACDTGMGLGPGSGCSGIVFPGSGCNGPVSVPPAIQINPSEDVGIAVGEVVSLMATYYQSGVPSSAVTFEWQSANPAVAEVDGSGAVRGVGVGSASIVATALGVRDSVTVYVRPPGLVFTDVNVGSRPCGLVMGGTAYCWLTSPIAVPGGRSFTAVSSGLGGHSCGLDAGRAYCWGQNEYGELGNAPGIASQLPMTVSGGLELTTVGVGNSFSCGLATNGVAYCWGRNDWGQLGTGSTTSLTRCSGRPCSPSPGPVTDGLIFRTITIGGDHVCGLVASGAAYCWGSNAFGALGNGGQADSPRPVAVAGGRTFAALSAGGRHTCGLTADGHAYCWGSNNLGRLGTRESPLERCVADPACSTRPIPVAEGKTFSSLSAGGEVTCGIDLVGTAFCWGAYYYRGANFSDTPLPVADGLRFRSVSAGRLIGCGLTTGRVAYCWRTGDNLRADSIVAVRVPGQSASTTMGWP